MEYTVEMLQNLQRMRLHLEWILASCIIVDEASFLGLPQFTCDEIFRWQENFHDRAQHFGTVGGQRWANPSFILPPKEPANWRANHSILPRPKVSIYLLELSWYTRYKSAGMSSLTITVETISNLIEDTNGVHRRWPHILACRQPQWYRYASTQLIIQICRIFTENSLNLRLI